MVPPCQELNGIADVQGALGTSTTDPALAECDVIGYHQGIVSGVGDPHHRRPRLDRPGRRDRCDPRRLTSADETRSATVSLPPSRSPSPLEVGVSPANRSPPT